MVELAERRIDPKVKYEIAQLPGGESVKYCHQCGRCAAVCPVGERVEDYSPLKVVRTIMLGSESKEAILSTDTIWRCLTCSKACVEVCPSNVEFPDFIEALRSMAIREGITKHVVSCERCGENFTTTSIRKFLEKQVPDEIELSEEKQNLCHECRQEMLRID